MGILSYNVELRRNNAINAYFDTGTTFNLVPQEDFRLIKLRVGQLLGRTPSLSESGGLTHFLCTEADLGKFKPIDFDLNLKSYQIPVNNYIQRTPKGTCVFKILTDQKENENWVLGLNFFNDYIVNFNTATKEVAIKKSPFFGKNNENTWIRDKWDPAGNSSHQIIDNSQDQKLTNELNKCTSGQNYDMVQNKCVDKKTNLLMEQLMIILL